MLLVGIGCVAVATLAYSAAGNGVACTDELSAPQSASQLGSWMSKLGKGHVGCLHAGTYGSMGQAAYVNPPVAGRSEADRVKVRGYPGESLPQVVGGIYFSATADYYTIRFMKVDGSSFGDDTIGLPRGADHVFLSDLDVTNGNRSGVHGCITSGGSYLIVNRDLLHNCGGDSQFDHCVYLGHGVNPQVVSNVIYGCASWAIHLYPGSFNSYVHNNVLDSSAGGVIFGGEDYGSSCEHTDYARVANNAIANISGIHAGSTEAAVADNWPCTAGVGDQMNQNCFWSNAHGDWDLSRVSVGTGNLQSIDANPQYQPGHHIPQSSLCYPLVGDPAGALLIPSQ